MTYANYVNGVDDYDDGANTHHYTNYANTYKNSSGTYYADTYTKGIGTAYGWYAPDGANGTYTNYNDMYRNAPASFPSASDGSVADIGEIVDGDSILKKVSKLKQDVDALLLKKVKGGGEPISAAETAGLSFTGAVADATFNEGAGVDATQFDELTDRIKSLWSMIKNPDTITQPTNITGVELFYVSGPSVAGGVLSYDASAKALKWNGSMESALISGSGDYQLSDGAAKYPSVIKAVVTEPNLPVVNQTDTIDILVAEGSGWPAADPAQGAKVSADDFQALLEKMKNLAEVDQPRAGDGRVDNPPEYYTYLNHGYLNCANAVNSKLDGTYEEKLYRDLLQGPGTIGTYSDITNYPPEGLNN